MVEDAGKETSRMAETDDGCGWGCSCEAFDDVVDGDIGGSTDEDSLVELEELED